MKFLLAYVVGFLCILAACPIWAAPTYINPAQLGSGTANSSTVLHGNQTWGAASSGIPYTQNGVSGGIPYNDSTNTLQTGSSYFLIYPPLPSYVGSRASSLLLGDNIGNSIQTQTNLIQDVAISGTGSYVLNYGGTYTTPISVGTSVATVQTDFTGLSSVGAGNCTVSGSTGAMVFTFIGTLGNTAVTELSFKTDAMQIRCLLKV
jgi:hypothetical protein